MRDNSKPEYDANGVSPDGGTFVKHIGSENAEKLITHDGVTNIGKNAFKECDSLTVLAPKDSYTEHYARENGVELNLSNAPILSALNRPLGRFNETVVFPSVQELFD